MKHYSQHIIIIFTFLLFSQFSTAQIQMEEGSVQFSFDLYNKLKTSEQTGNIFFSPLSITSAFTVPYAGASGLTRKQIERVFYYDNNEKKNLKIYADYTKSLERSKDVTLRIANGLWLEESMIVNKNFLKNTKQLTGRSDIYRSSFTKNHKACRSQINGWVAKNTEGNINELIPKKGLNELTKFVMANAIYFKGDWQLGFNNKLTATNSFYGLDDNTIETTFMTKGVADHKYYETDIMQIVELPYKGKSTSMVIILPRFEDGLDKIESSLTATNYHRWMKAMTKRPVVVTMPKFHLKIQYDLRSTFRKMGLKEPFTDAAAFDNLSPKGGMRISKVFHQAFIVVSEQGTQASAGTGVVGGTKGSLKQNPAIFLANQPFLFFIKDNETDMILFMGRMTEPEHSETITYTTVQPPRYPDKPIPTTDQIHWVDKGESLYGISKKYNVTIDQIKRLNNMTDNSVKIGQELLIQEGEIMGSKTPITTGSDYKPDFHVVNLGESLFSISKKYNVSLDKLKALNGMDDYTIFIGQKLILKKQEQSKGNNVKPTPKPKPTPTPTPKPKPTVTNQKTYKVQKGDTLWKISQQFKIPMAELKKINNLQTESVQLGQTLKVK